MESSTNDEVLATTACVFSPAEEAVGEDYKTTLEVQNTLTPPENTPAKQKQGYQVVFIPELDSETPIEEII